MYNQVLFQEPRSRLQSECSAAQSGLVSLGVVVLFGLRQTE